MMLYGRATQSESKGQRTGVLLAKITAILSAPVILFAFSSNPPTGMTGAPGESTCAGCHGPLTTGSGVTVTFPSMTYTPGGAAVSWTVNSPSGSGGFELSTRVQTDNSQAGSLTAGTASAVSTSSSIQYIYQSSRASSWTFTWTPPATNVGSVVVYVVGVSGGTFTNTYTLTPAATSPETLTLNTSSLTFTYSGSPVATQAVQVTSSGAPIPVTTVVGTSSGGTWLTATPPGGNTPLGVTVSVNPAGLAVGTYTGTVTVASTGATNSPQTVAVTFNVTVAAPPTLPTLVLSSSALNFTAAMGGTATPQNVQVSSSDSSTLAFTAAAATTSGGTWLSVSPASASTPSAEMISVSLTGLAVGTYQGTVTFTSSGASNSPVTVNVTLTVTSTTPPTTSPAQFSFTVSDKQQGGTDTLLLDGSGSIDAGGHVTGSGHFTRTSGGTPGCSVRDDDGGSTGSTVVASGTWTATSVTSESLVTGGGGTRSGGVIVLAVNISTTGSSSSTGSLRIASTGNDTGVTFSIDGGATFVPGTGRVSITTASSGSGGSASGGDN